MHNSKYNVCEIELNADYYETELEADDPNAIIHMKRINLYL